MAQACCEPVLQSSTEQWAGYFALTSAAVLCCCISAHLCGEQISIGTFAVAQACCEPVLQSCIEQWAGYVALTSAAVLCCCISAHLCGEQISIGVTAVAHPYCSSADSRQCTAGEDCSVLHSTCLHCCFSRCCFHQQRCYSLQLGQSGGGFPHPQCCKKQLLSQ